MKIGKTRRTGGKSSLWFYMVLLLVLIGFVCLYTLLNSPSTPSATLLSPSPSPQRAEIVDAAPSDPKDLVLLSNELKQSKGRTKVLEKELNSAKEALEHVAAANQLCRDNRSSGRPTAVNEHRLATNQQEAGALFPILVVCYNRPDYLRKTLDTLLKHRPSADQFPIIVSQDGDGEEVWKVLTTEYKDQVFAIQNKDRQYPARARAGESLSYYYIAAHYYFALHHVFDLFSYRAVVIVEEDLQVAPDFYEYFKTMLPFLESNPDLYVASAFNDNGQDGNVRDEKALRRTNFFPGLGWMMTRALWKELGPKWPKDTGYWDDWMREPEQRQGRDSIHPEISRTYTFGAKGASSGQFFESYLAKIKLNDAFVPFSELDLTYLKKEAWEDHIQSLLTSAIPISSVSDVGAYKDAKLVLYYNNVFSDFKTLASRLGVMSDEKAGVPRTAYNGVVMLYKDSNLILLAPKK